MLWAGPPGAPVISWQHWKESRTRSDDPNNSDICEYSAERQSRLFLYALFFSHEGHVFNWMFQKPKLRSVKYPQVVADVTSDMLVN